MPIREREIDSNINFFLTWSKVVLLLCIFFGLLISTIVIISYGKESVILLIALVILIGSIILGIIFHNILKWFAYMLYTNKYKM